MTRNFALAVEDVTVVGFGIGMVLISACFSD